jgi:hypothetical protein
MITSRLFERVCPTTGKQGTPHLDPTQTGRLPDYPTTTTVARFPQFSGYYGDHRLDRGRSAFTAIS